MLQKYLEELKKIKLLSPEEEKELWIREAEGSETAHQKLISAYQPLVFKTAAQEKKPGFRFPSGTRAPVSFPVLGSVAREMVRREKEAAPAAVSGSAQPFRLTRPFSPISPEQVEKSHAKVKAQLRHNEDSAEKSKPKEAWSTDEERDKIIRAGWERLAKLATPKNRTAAEDPKSEPSRSQPKKRKKRKRA